MFGKALRATAINREAASLMGIDVKKMITFSFAMSAAIGSRCRNDHHTHYVDRI